MKKNALFVNAMKGVGQLVGTVAIVALPYSVASVVISNFAAVAASTPLYIPVSVVYIFMATLFVRSLFNRI